MSTERPFHLAPFASPPTLDALRAGSSISVQAQQELKATIHRNLLTRVDLEKVVYAQDERMKRRLLEVIHELMLELETPLSAAERQRLSSEVLDEVFGLGPLEPLLADPSVNDILVNGPSRIYVERGGLIEKTRLSFKDNAHLMHIIEKIVSAVGRRVDESSPMVDARLADGSRVNITIPPLALDGPTISIRRFGKQPLEADDLVGNGTLTEPMVQLLRGAVRARINIVISGGTGSGKTTLLNVLSRFISERERILTIEDSAELQLRQEHVVRLECRPPNVEGKGAIRTRELVINALRMRPDRIVIGEVRGEEALDMLQAMNTGHDGSITTIHANSPRDAIARLETMALMANLRLPEKAIRQQIASAVGIILQISRLSDGTRRLTHFTEITGMAESVVATQDIFLFDKRGVDQNGRVLGSFHATGVMPRFVEKLKASGLAVPVNMTEHYSEVA